MAVPSVALAAHDFVPVLVAGAGLGYVAARVRATDRPTGTVAVAGAALVVGGGVAKATAKLVGAVAGTEPPVLLDESLFPLLAPGMVLVAIAVAGARRARQVRRAAVWVLAGLAAVVGAVAASAGWDGASVVLIAAATAGNVALGVELIRWSSGEGRRGAAWLFAVNLVVVIGLAGLSRGVEQTVGWQWVEQNTNLVAQVAFLVAARILARAGADPRRGGPVAARLDA